MNTLVNEKVIFCAKCVESNQRYVSSIAFKDKKDSINQEQGLIKKLIFVGLVNILKKKRKLIGKIEKKS